MKKNNIFVFITFLLLSLFISTGQATPLGVNLIKNPSAEANGSNSDCNATIVIDDWETADDTIVIPLDYGTILNGNNLTPPKADFASETFGNSVFFGGLVSAEEKNPRMTQSIDISDRAVEIDKGMLKFEVSGYFGGYLNQNDSAKLYAFFYDQNNELQSTPKIGSGTALTRGNITTMLKESISDIVLPGTRTITFMFQWTLASGEFQNGIADNLSFVIIPLPGIMTIESQGSTNVVEG
ncbi:MAG TPA: hypothetical protein PLP05_09900, partial [Sedimentisphaerales bacterium]|nr:hypothetical protein [Sedimentisphaerales bacterium]